MARSDFEDQKSGSALNNCEFTVTDAYFAPASEKYIEAGGGSNQFMHWLGTTNLEELPTVGKEDFHPSWKLGDDWDSVDGGRTVITSKRSNRPKMGKAYGTLCEEVLKLVPEGHPDDPMAGANHPSNASIWIGTKWYLEEKVERAGTQFESRRLFPTKFLGKASGGGGVATNVTNVTNITAAPSSNGGVNLRQVLEAIAKNSNTYQEFQAKALALPGVTEDYGLLGEITDESGFYAKVRG